MSSFEEIRHQCQEKKELWKDPDFPASQSSIFYYQTPPFSFDWKRPNEIVPNPAFLSSECDILPGKLGDNWLASCLNCLRLTEGLLYRVVPADQTFRTDEYFGAFRFRIWWFGEWVEVCVDDRLPVVKNQLVFMHAKEPIQFWPALLEKAYAKLHGSYEALKYGTLLDGLADLTGGIAESVTLQKTSMPCNILLENLLKMTSIVTCRLTYPANEDLRISTKLSHGLKEGESYRITSISKIKSKGGEEIEVLRLKRTHRGHQNSQNIHDWNSNTKNSNQNEKDLVIPYSYWLQTFTQIDIVHLDGETSRDEPSLKDKNPWTARVYKGQWKKGVSAGGCRNYLESFHMNPQLLLSTLKDNTDLVMSVSQFNANEPQVIGFSAYPYDENEDSEETNHNVDAPFEKDYYKSRRSAVNSQYTNSRQVSLRTNLREGSFLVLPTTYEPNQEGSFSFRILANKPIRLRLHETTPMLLRNPLVRATETAKGLAQYHGLFMQAADEQKCVNPYELQELLEICLPNDYIKSCASLDVCRQTVVAFDSRGFGKISYKEFKDLICSIKFWQSAFKNHTKEKTGILKAERFADALFEVGFKLTPSILSSLLFKYLRKDGTLRFGDFVAAILSLTIAFDSYVRRDQNNSGHVKLSQSEFLKLSVSC